MRKPAAGRALGVPPAGGWGSVAAAQVGQDEQSLPAAGQAPPPGADPTAVTCEETGEVLQGAAGQIDAGRVDKHAKAPGGLVILVVNPSTRSSLHARRRGHPPNHPSGWKRLTGEPDGRETVMSGSAGGRAEQESSTASTSPRGRPNRLAHAPPPPHPRLRNPPSSIRSHDPRCHDRPHKPMPHPRIHPELARHLNLEPNNPAGTKRSLGREFRRVYGESPYVYLMTRRIERAMMLLRRGGSADGPWSHRFRGARRSTPADRRGSWFPGYGRSSARGGTHGRNPLPHLLSLARRVVVGG